jgi:cytochrome c oxidase subunit 1
MFWLGLNGMNRRIADYIPRLETTNLFISVAGFFLGMSFVVFLFNYIYSWARGPAAANNPWDATTLEWQISSPPPLENFDEFPEILDDPYTYGTPGATHSTLEPARFSKGDS